MTCQCTNLGKPCKNTATHFGGYIQSPIWIGWVCSDHFFVMKKVGFQIIRRVDYANR